MSHTTHLKSELEQGGPISEEGLAYLEQRALGQFYDYVLEKFEDEVAKSGLTKAALARRVRRGPDQVNKLLASPGNWTIGTLARLLAGIAGEEPILSSTPLLGKRPQNMKVMDLLEEGGFERQPSDTNPFDVAQTPTTTSAVNMTARWEQVF